MSTNDGSLGTGFSEFLGVVVTGHTSVPAYPAYCAEGRTTSGGDAARCGAEAPARRLKRPL